MDASPTLQDFVLNLIYDPAARSAFELDPETTLQHAGLGDVTAADVQQVIPMVVDYAPAAGVTDIGGIDDIYTGVANLDVAGAVAQLQAITSHAVLAPTTGVNTDVTSVIAGVHTTAVGVTGGDILSGSVLSGNTLLSGNNLGLEGLGGVSTVAPVGVSDLGVANDPGLHLDNGVVAPVTTGVDGVDDVAGGNHIMPETGVNPVGVLDTVANVPSSIGLDHTTGLDVSDIDGATSSVGSVIKPDLSNDVVHNVHSTVTNTVDATHGLTSSLPVIGHETTDVDGGHGLLGGLTDLHH
jgi:hypothetical protein